MCEDPEIGELEKEFIEEATLQAQNFYDGIDQFYDYIMNDGAAIPLMQAALSGIIDKQEKRNEL